MTFQINMIALNTATCYNPPKLGIGLAVGQRTLDRPVSYENSPELLSRFLSSRRQGLSKSTLKFYKGYLRRASVIVGTHVTCQDISRFLDSLECSNGGKHAYYRVLRTFYRWLYSPKSGYGLNPQDNPMLNMEAPKVAKPILPSPTGSQIGTLVAAADSIRDKCIISLLADSGMRLGELTSIQNEDINWDACTVTIWGKGNKQRRAPFTKRTANMLQCYLPENPNNGNIWGLNQYGVQKMLKRLGAQTGIKCNLHSFRRGFAYNLHRKGLSTLDIMHLGGWQDLSMVLRYTRSITFDDCLKHYRNLEG